MLQSLIPPRIPPEPLPPREQLKVWARTDLLNHVVECCGLLGMPPNRPLEPARSDTGRRRWRGSTACDDAELDIAFEGAAKTTGAVWFAPHQHGARLELPCPGYGMGFRQILGDRPEKEATAATISINMPAISFGEISHGHSGNIFDRHHVVRARVCAELAFPLAASILSEPCGHVAYGPGWIGDDRPIPRHEAA